MPPSNACRKRAGSVSRFLSSIVCSCSPRSIVGALHYLPLCPTINHPIPLVHPSEGSSLDTASRSVRYRWCRDLNHLSGGRNMKRIGFVVAVLLVPLAAPLAARAGGTVGTSFPAGFAVPTDASLGVPVLGFGAAGPVHRTPVILLHGNNDTPYPTICNPYGNV